jgi:acetyl esterase
MRKVYMNTRPEVKSQVYLERGQPVVILIRWRKGSGGPRNVLIGRQDGTRVVRPFSRIATFFLVSEALPLEFGPLTPFAACQL